MSDKLIELLKGPVLVLTLLSVILILNATNIVDFENLTEVSTSGLKFREKKDEKTLDVLIEYKSEIDDLSARLKEVERLSDIDETKLKVASARAETDVVSDATAALTNLKIDNEPITNIEMRGYIFIGTYEDTWIKKKIEYENGDQVESAPNELKLDRLYRVTGNMVLRDGLPPNNSEYFRARKRLAVVNKGTSVKFLRKPELIDRPYSNEYWVEVGYK